MDDLKQEDLWFNTPDSPTLCRGGGNGPNHPTQLYAIRKYVRDGMTFLDYGAGSGTTYEAMKDAGIQVDYAGLDVIKKNADWCNEYFKTKVFNWNPTIHEIDADDKSFDVVYSRHVVDHMKSFEEAMDEHKRVAKELVIVVGWVPFSDRGEHEIKNIDYRHNGGVLYENEYTNQYSRDRVKQYLKDPEWEVLEFIEEVGTEVSGHDWIIVLKRKEENG